MTLNEDFTTVDLGELSFFKGCAVIQDIENRVTKINQNTFIETLARRFDVTTTAPYPATPGANLGPRMESESGGTWPYREAVGALMWLVESGNREPNACCCTTRKRSYGKTLASGASDRPVPACN